MENLIDILKNEDYRGFKAFIRSDKIARVSCNEELEFFKTAPEHWQKAYLNTMWMQPQSERCLMITGSQDVLRWSYKSWGFWRENVLWAFSTASPSTCLKVLMCYDEYPGAEMELAMIRRNDLQLLKVWLEKYHELGEDAERYLEEQPRAAALKNEYINYVISRQVDEK